MATGKTHPRYITVLLDDSGGTPRDITSSISSIGDIGIAYDQADVTAINDSVMQYLAGRGDADIQFSGPFNNTATTGAHAVFTGLNGANTAATLTVQFGIRAAATNGDPEFEGEFVVTSYLVGGDMNSLTWSASLKPAFGAAAPAWGTV